MLVKPGELGLPENVNGQINFQSLFMNGESGYLFRNFSDLSKLYTQYTGTPPVGLDGNLVGLVLDESQMIGKTVAQAAAASPELRGNGTIGLIGTATAATYNTSTGEATATRAADGGNQSYITVPVTLGDTYLIDVTVLTTGVNLRDTVTGAISYTWAFVGARKQVVVRSGTSALFFQSSVNSATASFIIHSIKRIPGNHAAQSSGGRRPSWNAPSDINANLLFDGIDDSLNPPFRPMVSGTGLTMAAAFFVSDISGTQRIIMGGGDSSNRAFIALIASGALGIGWGTQVNRGNTFQDLRNGWHTVIVTGEGSNRDIWLDGKNITSDFAAASGTPGTSGPIVIGGRQTSVGGAVDQNMPGNISAVLTLDRRVSQKEINLITTEFQKTFTTPVPTLVSKLFSSGEKGYYHGNFDQTNKAFTLFAGGRNVFIDNDPVGIVLDESSWGGLSVHQILAKQPNLTTPGSWMMSTAGGTSTAVESPAGTLTLFSDGTNGARGDFQMTTVPNMNYCVDVTIATAAVTILVGTAQGQQNLMAISPNPGNSRSFFVASGTTTWIRLVRNAGGTSVVSGIQVRAIPGYRNSQVNGNRRPLWRMPTSDVKSSLQFDGVDDALFNSFRPMETGTGLTMATAFYSTQGDVQASPMGGGSSVGPSRAYIALLANGVLSVGWGTQINRGGPSIDLRNGWHIVIVTGEGSNRDIWLDGVNITDQFAAASGTPGNGPMSIGARQNESGSPDLFMPGNISAALAIDRRVTLDEIKAINFEFRKTFTSQEPTLSSLLFGSGERGYLFGNFRQLDRLFTLPVTNSVNITADAELFGLALDDSKWGGTNVSQLLASQPIAIPSDLTAVSGSSGWTAFVNVSGAAVRTPTTLHLENPLDRVAAGLNYSVTHAIGKTLRVSVTVSGTGTLRVQALNGAGAASSLMPITLTGSPTTYVAYNINSLAGANFGVGIYGGSATSGGNPTDVTFHNIDIREVPGYHAFQSTLVDRPTWRFGSGLPFLQNGGGAADALLTQFYPFDSGSGLTMAAAFNVYLNSSIAIGGGNTSTNNRATMGIQSNGQLSVGWGTEISETVIVDRRNINQVLIVTGDGTGRDIWLNGQNITSLFFPASGAPNNTGGALAIGGRQNSNGGTTDRNLGGNIYAALTLDRRVTREEIARINTVFQSTFPVN